MKSFPGEGIMVVMVEPLSEVIRKSGRGGKDLETMLIYKVLAEAGR